MKNKGILITTILFFLIVNTTYYWEGKLGLFAFPAFLILAVAYFIFAIALIQQIYFAFKEKFKNNFRLITIRVLTFVLALTFIKPFGLVDFDTLEGDTILIAEREGSANCMTTLKLKDDFTFRERNICFGVTEILGKYHLRNDTIYFDTVNVGRNESEFYKFAVISQTKSVNDKFLGKLVRYKSVNDTIEHELWITKIDLEKLKKKKTNR